MDEQWLEKQRKSELKQRQKELRIEDFENARMRQRNQMIISKTIEDAEVQKHAKMLEEENKREQEIVLARKKQHIQLNSLNTDQLKRKILHHQQQDSELQHRVNLQAQAIQEQQQRKQTQDATDKIKRFDAIEKRVEIAKSKLVDAKEQEKQRLTELAVKHQERISKEYDKVQQKLDKQRNESLQNLVY